MKFLIVGDSHAQYFNITNQLRVVNHSLRGINAVTKAVSAATVTGVGRLSSTLGLGSDIPRWLESYEPDFAVFNLGQVDVELGVPFRQYVLGDEESVEDRLKFFISTYVDYLDGLDIDSNKIIVKGVNLPVLCYDRAKSVKYIMRILTERFADTEVDKERRASVLKNLTETYTSDVMRTDLALHYNSMLASACAERGFGYFDINEQLMDEKLGMIDPRFIPSKFDHHIVDSLEVRSMHWNWLIKTARNKYWH
ncbi:hypothetical protein [Paeniglutamicibacter sp. Y32M11]|uniref:hypothetical protein n=1 Tax=Paeniglutamicibacter sp. Y32M11 TaxID=2853258 RepID=UPI001C52836D|nr:hypothetical protein [Paeniglutamicibacter sp. Y32M11]QXQ08975.1 hypothetical protein KUF55_10605 [Paeniglutamicibacter sp. Y32M11]